MNLKQIASLVLIALALLGKQHAARGGEPAPTSQQTSQTTSTRTADDYFADTQYRLVDGKLVPVSPSTGGGGSSTPTAPAPAITLPFDHFDADGDGSSIINSYFLAYLSFLVYSSQTDVDDFEEELLQTLAPQGVVDVQAFMNSHGVEGAIVSTPDATIVVFRGTSSDGTDVPLADYLADADDDARPVTIAGKKLNVHDGFWTAAASIYPFIYQHAGAADLAGRKVWVTGHSLGAAVATATALRLHYDDGVNVQGLQTFGSPKVGDVDMLKMFQSPNVDGRILGNSTVRWVVDGDPVTTFFLKDVVGFNLTGPIYVYYRHVGATNTIYALENGGYETKYNTGENKYMLWDVGGLTAEHMWYLEALTCELTVSLMDAGQLDVLEEILQAP